MKVASDLGGLGGYGPVVEEIDEPIFHADWEGRVLGLTLAMGATGTWTLDGSRFAREDRPRDEYVALRYYELWLRALERLLLEHQLVTVEELRFGEMMVDPAPIKRRLESDQVSSALRSGSPTVRPTESSARFAVNGEVRTRAAEPPGHTRLPTYARGKRGRITAIHGCHVFPDTNAHGEGEQPQWLYTVAFTGTELFGQAGDPNSVVSIDAFEPYLEGS